MIGLAWALARAGGWSRVVIVIISGAIVSALLLVGLSWLLLPDQPREELFQLINDPGTRVGAILSVLLLTVPLLALLYQGVRLGTAARERRLAGLRLAGATVRQVRLLGGIEVGLVALAGAVLGIGLFAVLREWLGGIPHGAVDRNLNSEPSYWSQSGLGHLIPQSVSLNPAYVAIVVLVVGATGFVIGARASATLTISPLGVSRRHQGRRPRPWLFLALLTGAAACMFLTISAPDSEIPTLLLIALSVLAMLSLSPWVAFLLGQIAQRRANTAAGLIAARRLIHDPHTVGRAAAATGAIGLIAGGAAAFFSEFFRPDTELDGFFAGSYLLVLVALLAALGVAIATMTLHSIETIWDRKRSMAGLAAMGASASDLQRSQRIEACLVAVTTTGGGYVLGSLVMLPLTMSNATGLGFVSAVGVAILGTVWLGTAIAVVLTRPFVTQAITSQNLRAA